MIKRTFFGKIFLSYASLICAISFLIFIFSFKIIKNYYIETLSRNLVNINETLSLKLIPLVINKNKKNINKIVKEIGKKINTRITVISINGEVLGDSEKNPEEMENHRYRPEVEMALNLKVGKSIRFSRTVKKHMLYIATPLYYKNKVIGIVRSSLYLKQIDLLLKKIKYRILKISLILLFIVLIISIILSKKFSQPINILLEATKKIAKGEFNIQIFLNRNDEFKSLADNFNIMAYKIRKLFNELNYDKEELNNIISSMNEGLLVIGEDGRIVHYNNKLKEICKVENIDNKFYWELISDNEFISFVKDVINSKQKKIKELIIKDKILRCSSSYVEKTKEYLFILSDITDIKEVERIKKDFVSNVSHELRTPLTAIKGYVETLMNEEKNKEKKHYLKVIERHTERLINIVNDLLILSKLEEQEKIKKEKVNIRKLIDTVVTLFKEKAEDKGLQLEIKVNKSLNYIYGDSFKLEQMFINLIDNAIKYTDKGKVHINIKKENNFIKIEISDTGIGIPASDLNKIFERFYVVNKSRSRKFGGTGLGLSIVKHIVMLHNGILNVESEEGRGTKFIIKLPEEK